MEQGGEKADSARSGRAAAPLASPTLREPFHIVDAFLDPDEAGVLRGHFEAHFAEPHMHSPATHQLWNYWHVPDRYTYLRTSPEKVIPRALVDGFHARLSQWALETLGLGFVTWPYLRLYVHGCCQHPHDDPANGRFGFVYSLTPDTRGTQGGETIVMRGGHPAGADCGGDAEASARHELIAPSFNRLTIFDSRMPHGVRPIEGSMDPLDGRVVLHGHISEGDPHLRGPLSAGAVAAIVADAAEAGLLAAGASRDEVHGPLTLRLSIAADGAVAGALPLVDRVVTEAGGDARPAVESILAHISQLRFAPQPGPSEAWIPVMLGGAMRRADERSGATVPVAAASYSPEPVAAATPADAVAAHLSTVPGLFRIPEARIEAFVVPDFLTEEECERLEQDGDAALLDHVEARMAALTGIDPSLGDPVEMQVIGDEGAAAAWDFFDLERDDWSQQQDSVGRRSWTIMGFLDAPEEGGEIVFPNLGFTATPARGLLLVWKNLPTDGAADGFAVHETRPVTRGIHRRFVKRYRERVTGPVPAGAPAR